MKTTLRRASGFTLIEALITISIVAILASIAIPSFTKMIESNRISSASNDFLSALMLTRSEAAKRSISVTICTSSNGRTCGRGLDDYAGGWIVFTDCDGNKAVTAVTTCDLDGDGTADADQVLRIEDGLKGVTILGNTDATKDAFTYQFSGRSAGTATFSIGTSATNLTKEISVGTTGRARLTSL